MFYFYTNVLKFTPSFLSILRALNSISMVAGIVIYYAFFKNVSYLIKDPIKKIINKIKYSLHFLWIDLVIINYKTKCSLRNTR